MHRKTGYLLVLALVILLTGTAWAESAGELLTSTPVETVLLISGGVFLVLSVLTMGSGVAETLCFGSFTLLFVGRYLQGEDPWTPLGLLVLGSLCLMAEVFILPGFGIFGIMGLLAIAAMTVMVAGGTAAGLAIFMLTTMLSVLAGFMAIRLLPHNRFTRKLFILQPPQNDSPAPATPAGYTPAVGEKGVAATSLRPGGYASFGNERVDVTAENEFVPKGQAVEVLRTEGFKVVVRSVRPASQS